MTRTSSTPVWTATLTALLVVVFPGPSHGQQSVTLTFNWPADLHAKVQYTATRARTVRGEDQVLEMRGSYHVDTESVDDGLLVRFSNLEVNLPGAPGRNDPHARLQEFMAKAGSTIPDYVVDENGRILRVEGLEQMHANVEAALAQIANQLPQESRGPLQAMLRKTLTHERLEASVRQNWDRDVGTWNGTTLEVGQRYEQEQMGKAGMLGDMEVPMRITYQLHGRRRCHDSAAAESCIEIELRSFVNSENLSQAFEDYLRGMGGGGARAPKLDDMTIDHRLVLLTEPDTLIPHSMETERTTSVAFSKDGVRQSTRQFERKTVVYRYQR